MFDSKSLLPSRKGRDRRVFLFELYIVFAKEAKLDNSSESRSTSSSNNSLASTGSLGGTRTRYVYKNRLLTAEVGITEHVDSDETKFAIWTHGTDHHHRTGHSAHGNVQENKIILKCSSLDAKLLWVKKMREVRTFSPSNERALSKHAHHVSLTHFDQCVCVYVCDMP